MIFGQNDFIDCIFSYFPECFTGIRYRTGRAHSLIFHPKGIIKTTTRSVFHYSHVAKAVLNTAGITTVPSDVEMTTR